LDFISFSLEEFSGVSLGIFVVVSSAHAGRLKRVRKKKASGWFYFTPDYGGGGVSARRRR
jgi:hypothetical protein